MNILSKMLVISYYIDQNWAMEEEQLTFDQDDSLVYF